MINLDKYRKLSFLAIILLVVGLLLTFAALWNSLLTSEVKHEGWVVVFLLFMFAVGVFLFFIAYKTADPSGFEKSRKMAYESGKSEVLQEMEKKNQEEKSDDKVESADIEKAAGLILSGMQGIRSENSFCNRILTNLAREMGFVQGIFYVKDKKQGQYNPSGEYALTDRKPEPFKIGEGLAGQVAENKSAMTLYDVPEHYFTVSSGLGSSQPRFLLIVPVLFNEESIAVLELASFKKPDEITGRILDKVSSELGPRLNKFVVA
jgi:putative methionine-R-sulfoxide reductase with GAF domain